MAETQKILSLNYPSDMNNDIYANRRIIFMAMPGEPIYESQKKFYESNKLSDIEKNAESLTDVEVKAIITLPLPSSLSDTQSHTWSKDSLHSAVDVLGDIGDALSNVDTSILNKFGTSSVTKLFRLGKSIKNAYVHGRDAFTYGVGTRKILLKPGYYQNYDTSDLRSFSFAFEFVPENEEESKNIRKIITAFKALSSPSTYGQTKQESVDKQNEVEGFSIITQTLGKYFDKAMEIGTMYSPFVWQIIVCNEKVNKMLQLKTCVCSRVDVTYGDDKFDCFDDGMPKHINLKLDFSEVQLQYAENYAQTLNLLENEYNYIPTTITSTDTAKKIRETVKDLNDPKINKDAKTQAGKDCVDADLTTVGGLIKWAKGASGILFGTIFGK